MTRDFLTGELTWALAVSLCFVLVGCSRSPSGASTSNSIITTQPVAKIAPPVIEASAVDEAVAPDKAVDESETVTASEDPATTGSMMIKPDESGVASREQPEQVEGTAAEQESDIDPSDRYRFLAPTTAGPVVIEMELCVDDQPMSTAFNQHIATVIKAADRNDDGTISVDELVTSDTIWNTRFGRPAMTEDQRRTTVRGIDRDRNQKLDRDEMIQFLSRDGGTSRPFSLRGSSYYRGQNRIKSSTAHRLNTDRDQAISIEEIAAAADRLMLLDRNGDQIITNMEVVDFDPGQDPAWRKRGSGFRADSATVLASFTQWNMLSYALAGAWQLAKNGGHEWANEWLSELDLNADGQLDKIESKALLDVEPHVRVSIRFPAKRLVRDNGVVVAVTHLSEGLQASIVHEQGRVVVLQIGSLRLRLVARDNPPAFAQQARQILEALDANDDDAVDEDEIPEQFAQAYGSFEDADVDGNGKLVYEELVNFGQSLTPLWFYQVRARAGEQPDALFEWLDSDGDGRLITREIAKASARLNELDRNGDGKIDPEEIPEGYLVQLFRGEPNQDNQPITDMHDLSGKHDVPGWAQAMDSNADGDISRNEFVGTSEHFGKFDRDADGFIGYDELLSY